MIRETETLIDAVKKMYPVAMFLKNRYFPDGRCFYSEKALVEMKKAGRKIAPFVVPVVGGIAMSKEGYRTEYLTGPYIAPRIPITADDLEKKAFGESPESGRSPEEREDELEGEFIDELRQAIFRRHEKMCVEIITTGKVLMKHYSSADDAANDRNAQERIFQYYDTAEGFTNEYKLSKKFAAMSAQEKMQELYKMAAVLIGRGIHATDLVMTSDVSMALMSDEKFLDFFNKARVETGIIDQKMLPDGVVCNGTININGLVLTMFTYAEKYVDLDGKEKPLFPAGTIAMLTPGMGATAYAQVTLVEKGEGFKSYAEPVVVRLLDDDNNNMVDVQAFSRPIPYPKDWEGWLVAQEPEVSSVSESDTTTEEKKTVSYKTTEEINAMTTKASVIEYAESIGLTGLSDSSKLDELKTAVINYQEEKQAAGE